MKLYQHVSIEETGEPLVAIPTEIFALVQPHPYAVLGAPYADKSPFYVRRSVLERLKNAQIRLQSLRPGWRIQIFDAYRPLEVQQFMVDYTFAQVVQRQGLELEGLAEIDRQKIYQQVYEFWAIPDADPTRPPPHSTGAAVDVTLVDETGQVINMGSAIDELSPRSYPNHFATSLTSQEQYFHQQRELLDQIMTEAGFMRHPNEWWHFCYGDQMWAWLRNQASPEFVAIASYGRIK